MPMIDSDKLKPAVDAWAAAADAWTDATHELRVATDTAPANVPMAYEQAQDAHERYHNCAREVALLARRLIQEAERKG